MQCLIFLPSPVLIRLFLECFSFCFQTCRTAFSFDVLGERVDGLVLVLLVIAGDDGLEVAVELGVRFGLPAILSGLAGNLSGRTQRYAGSFDLNRAGGESGDDH